MHEGHIGRWQQEVMWIEWDAETLKGGREDEQARHSVVGDDNVGFLDDITDRNTDTEDDDQSQ